MFLLFCKIFEICSRSEWRQHRPPAIAVACRLDAEPADRRRPRCGRDLRVRRQDDARRGAGRTLQPHAARAFHDRHMDEARGARGLRLTAPGAQRTHLVHVGWRP